MVAGGSTAPQMLPVLAWATRHQVHEARESVAPPHFTCEVPELRTDALSAPFGYLLVVFARPHGVLKTTTWSWLANEHIENSQRLVYSSQVLPI